MKDTGNSCRYWCLKEAFTKATGVGIGNGLDNIEFHHVGWNDIFLNVDGKRLEDWRFWLLELGNSHSVSFHNLTQFDLL